MSRRGTVHSEDGLWVCGFGSHAAAIREAVRRAQVMHEKWPDTPWRLSVRKDRREDRPYQRHLFWAVYVRVLPLEVTP